MAEQKVFTWMAEEMLKSEFIQWVSQNGHSGISYPTIARAQERQASGVDLTARQQKAERLAKEFQQQWKAKDHAAQAA